MSPEEHAFYMTKLAKLEARAMELERRLAVLIGDDAADATGPDDASKGEVTVRKLVILN